MRTDPRPPFPRHLPGTSISAAVGSTTVLGAVFALAAAMRGLDPVLPAVGAGLFLFAVLLWRNASLIVHAMLVVLFITTVPEIPRGIRLGGIFVYFNEIAIAGAVLYAAWLTKSNPRVIRILKNSVGMRVVGAFGLVVLFGIGNAVVRGYPFWDIQYDARAIVELVAVIFVAAVIVTLDDWRRYKATVVTILIFSAVLMIYASATGFVLWGRTEAAELYATGGRAIGGGSEAVRYLTQTTPLALAVLLGCVAAIFLGRIPAATTLPFLLPALIVSVLSFSRNSILALLGALVFALLIAVANGYVLSILLRIAIVPVLVGGVIFLVLTLSSVFGARDWIDTQVAGYSNRVVAGLDETNERADTSANYREQESAYIRSAAAAHPILGGGFGTHYKPPTGQRGTFTAFEGTMYTHNAYNWFYVKVGLVGVAAFGAIIAVCVLPALSRRRGNGMLMTAASVLAGLSIAIVVTPMPIEQPGSAVLGIVMGMCIASALPQRVDEQV